MTQLFANGFESGDFSSWTGNYTQNGTAQVQNSQVNSGSYAGQFQVTLSGGYADAYKNLSSSYTTVNQRFYVRFNTLPASGEGVLLGFLANNSNNNAILGIGLRYSGGSAKWFVGYLKAGSYTLLYSSANTPQTNTWYCLEVKAVINSSSGTVEAWINGTKDNSLCDTSGFNNTAWGNINRAFVGQDSQTESTYPSTTYVDDLIVDESYIGTLGGAASKLMYTAGASQSVTAGSISSVITVQVQDSNGNPVTTGATVNLSTTSSGLFYSDSGGNTQITSKVISSGQSSGNCYYRDSTAGTPTLTASSTGLTSATTQFTINSSGSQYISSIAQGAPFTVASGALSLNVSSPLQVSNSSLGINASASPTFAGLTLNGMLNSNASGSSPAVNSNAGMILDCYTPNHRDGLGIQSGGIWLKYDDSFNIYNDNGSTLLQAVHLDNSGNMTIEGNLQSNVPAHAPVAGSNAGMILDCWISSHGDGLGIQSCGLWLKYDNNFNIYYDNGTTIQTVLALDNLGSHIFYDTGNYIYYDGTRTWVQNQSSPSTQNYIHVFCSTRSPYNPWGSPAANPLLYVDQSIFAENDIQTFGTLGTASDPQKGHGGGALRMGHGWTDPTNDMPLIELTDADGSSGYNTLWIKTAHPGEARASYLPWGNLELGSLNSHGSIIIEGSSTGGTLGNQYGYLNSGGSGSINGYTGNVPVSLTTFYRIICGAEIDVYSDQRDKNMVDTLIAQTALSAIVKLNPLHFAWKPETNKGDNVIAGFFAQEVAKTIPEAVIVYKGERYNDQHTLNYNVLTTYALSAIQFLAKEINDMRSEIKDYIKTGAS